MANAKQIGGINMPPEFTPYSTGPGMQQGQQLPIQGGNLYNFGDAESYYKGAMPEYLGPGASTAWYARNGNALDQQGIGETYAQGAAASLARGGVPKYQKQAWDALQRNIPHLNSNSGLNAYYDNAKRKASEQIAAKYAAMGMGRSSLAAGRQAESIENIEADRAAKEATYNIQADAANRAWQQLNLQGANLASGDQLQWMQGVGGLMNQAQMLGQNRVVNSMGLANSRDQNRMQQLNSGMNAAISSQGANRQRLQDMWTQAMGMGNTMAGLSGDAYNGMFLGDSGLLDDALGAELNMATEARNRDDYDAEKFKSGLNWFSGFMG